jgi:hypothetical protein
MDSFSFFLSFFLLCFLLERKFGRTFQGENIGERRKKKKRKKKKRKMIHLPRLYSSSGTAVNVHVLQYSTEYYSCTSSTSSTVQLYTVPVHVLHVLVHVQLHSAYYY